MTETQTPTSKRVELPADLLERVDEARGRTSRSEWLARAAEDKLAVSDAGPVVDLDEEPERSTVKFGSKLYELRHLDEMGIVEQQRLNRDGREFSELFQSDNEMDDDQAARLEFLQDRIFNKVIDADNDVRGSFTSAMRTRVVLAFTYAPARKQLAQLMQALQANGGNEPATTS